MNGTDPPRRGPLASPAAELPPWDVAPLPAPPAFTLRNVLRTVGPGVIGLGVALGGGEWLLGPSVVVRHGPTLLWVTTVAVVLQALLNLEMARYTLYTGEPITTGFMRTRPGPAFWGWVYSVLALLQYGWPGWALATATAMAALWLGELPTAGDAHLIIRIGYGTVVICLVFVLLGKKVERTLELVMWAMVALAAVYLIAVDLVLVSPAVWAAALEGFLSVGRVPPDADWPLIAAFAAYSGLGGVANAFITNWMRDKGYGMAATVGYVATVFGPRVELPPQGKVFLVNPENLAAWRRWWRYAQVDQWGIFALGSLLGMGLTCLLTLQLIPTGSAVDGWQVVNMQASALARTHGAVFWYLTILCGIGILLSTELGVIDGLPRAVTDVLWTSSAAFRRWSGGDVRRVYYTVVAVFAVWVGIGLNLAPPLTLLALSANIAGFILAVLSVHTLYVNRHLLPPAVRPPRWRQLALIACALFYGTLALSALQGWMRG